MQFADATILEPSRHFYVQSSAIAHEYLLRADSVGHFFVTEQYQISRINYDSYLLLLMMSGRLNCESQGQSATVDPDSVLLLDCTQPHRYWAAEDSEFMFIHMNGALIEPLYRGIHSGSGLVLSGFKTDAFQQTVTGILDTLEAGRTLRETQLSAQLYTLLMILLESARTCMVDEKKLAVMEEVQQYIQRHLHEKLTVDALAERTGYSTSHFNRLFIRATNQSPYQFITGARIDRAKHLLATSGLSIQEVADRCGFPNVSNFSYTFRQACGMTPTAFRKQPI